MRASAGTVICLQLSDDGIHTCVEALAADVADIFAGIAAYVRS